jgi:CheY-like chemotaxis protein
MPTTYSVFLVDDDKFLLEMYRKKFEQNNAKVEVAVGSSEALVRLRDGVNPDLLLLDIIMPTMDGLELLEIIRQEGLAKDSIIIMLTNESSSDKIEKARALKVDGYIVKATSIPSEVVEEALKIFELKKQ